MRPIGQPEAPILTPNAGAGFKLRAGVSVSVSILQKLSDTLYRVRAGGQTLVARSAVPLSPGSSYLGFVEKLPAGTGAAGAAAPGLALRLELGRPVPDSLAGLIAGTGLPDDALSREAALALLGAGEGVNRGNLGRVRRALESGAKSKFSLGDRSEAAARLESKGLAASADAVEALLSARDSAGDGTGKNSGRDGAGGGTDRGSGGRGNDSTGAPESGSSMRQTAVPDPDMDPAGFAHEFGSILRTLCGRSIQNGADSDAAALEAALLPAGQNGAGVLPSLILGLANHARSKSDDIVEFPFHIEIDSVAFRGSFRILLPYVSSGPGSIEAHFIAAHTAENGVVENSAWAFSLRTGCARPLLLISPGGSASKAAPFLAALKEELAGAGCELRLVAGQSPDGAEKEKGYIDIEV